MNTTDTTTQKIEEIRNELVVLSAIVEINKYDEEIALEALKAL